MFDYANIDYWLSINITEKTDGLFLFRKDSLIFCFTDLPQSFSPSRIFNDLNPHQYPVKEPVYALHLTAITFPSRASIWRSLRSNISQLDLILCNQPWVIFHKYHRDTCNSRFFTVGCTNVNLMQSEGLLKL